MSNSSLVNYTRISPNQSGARNHSIDTITIHCVVGQCAVETLGNLFADPSVGASSNYGVGYDGRIGMYVEEKDRSWCTSSSSNDNRAITIEVASDTYAPYAVTAKAYTALLDLVTDICKRNNIKELKWKADSSLIGQVDKQNMTAHRWFANKSCPGDYLYSRFGNIAAEVNRRLGSSEPDNPDNVHIVVAGDTLWGISQKYLGDGNRYPELMEYNQLDSPVIYVGQTIQIPSDSPEVPDTSDEISKGDTVTIEYGAPDYNGGSLAAFVYDRQYLVSELSGNRAVLTYDGVIVAAVDTKYLNKVSSGSSGSVDNSIKKGDRVKIKSGAPDYNGGSLASFVYPREYIVSELSGDRAVVTYDGVIVAAVNTANLIKI